MRLLLAALAALLCAAPAAGAATVQLRGTAYEFNNTDVRLAGAVIRVAERPKLRTTTHRDGRYVLTVPDGARITPYIEAPGYHAGVTAPGLYRVRYKRDAGPGVRVG